MINKYRKLLSETFRYRETALFRIRNDTAFTLFETIIVLGVLSAFFVFGVVVPKEIIQKSAGINFGNALLYKMNLAQQYAVISHNEVQIVVNPAQKEVVTNMPQDVALPIPKEVTMEQATIIFRGGTGSLKSYKQLYFQTDSTLYVLKIQFGKGVTFIETIDK